MLRLLLAGFVVLAWGCASPPPPRPNKSALVFDERSPTALFVSGFAVDRATNAMNVALWWTCYDPATGAFCPKHDPDGPKNIFGVTNHLLGYFLIKDFKSDKLPFHTMEYSLQRMKPGHYILAQATRVNAGMGSYPTYVTRYIDRDRTSADTKAPRFHAEAGKIYYLGDIRLDYSTNRPKLRRSFNEAAVQQFLATYPNVHGQIVPVVLRTED